MFIDDDVIKEIRTSTSDILDENEMFKQGDECFTNT